MQLTFDRLRSRAENNKGLDVAKPRSMRQRCRDVEIRNSASILGMEICGLKNVVVRGRTRIGRTKTRLLDMGQVGPGGEVNGHISHRRGKKGPDGGSNTEVRGQTGKLAEQSFDKCLR